MRALYFGTMLLAAWLVAAAMGERAVRMVNALFGHPLGKLVLFGYTWALLHHMLGGMRHLHLGHRAAAMQTRPADLLCVADHPRLAVADAGAVGRRPVAAGEGCDMSLRTPLAKVRGLGSAKEGTEHFWKQRLTAVANIFLVCFLIVLLVKLAGADHATVKRALAKPLERHPAAAAGALRRHPHAARYANHH